MTKYFAARTVRLGYTSYGDPIFQSQVLEFDSEAEREAAKLRLDGVFVDTHELYAIPAQDDVWNWPREFCKGKVAELVVRGVNCRMVVVFDHC